MRIADPPLAAARMRAFTEAGYWDSSTMLDALDRAAGGTPGKVALVDGREGVDYATYRGRARRLAGYFVELGLGAEDVVAIQLPNWNELAVAVAGAVYAGVPFCQFHSDFRVRELEFMLGFLGATTLILPARFRGFDYLAMLEGLRPRLPALRHVIVVGEGVPDGYFDLRGFLVEAGEVAEGVLAGRRPGANGLMRTAFTSGTTGDPKAVLHIHNTTGWAVRHLNAAQRIGGESVVLVFLPAGLNWGLFNVLQALEAGARLVLQDVFNAEEALALIRREGVTHFCCAPAHLVSMLNVAGLERAGLESLVCMMTGGASCPVEVIRAVQARMPGQLLEMYGMLEAGTQAHTVFGEDAEAVCGTVGRPVAEMALRVVDGEGRECGVDEAGEILSRGPGFAWGTIITMRRMLGVSPRTGGSIPGISGRWMGRGGCGSLGGRRR